MNSERLGQRRRVSEKSALQHLQNEMRQSSRTLPRTSSGYVESLRAYSMEQTQSPQDLEPEVGGVVNVDYLTLAERHVKDARSLRAHAL